MEESLQYSKSLVAIILYTAIDSVIFQSSFLSISTDSKFGVGYKINFYQFD